MQGDAKNAGGKSVEFLNGSIKGPERYACGRMQIQINQANHRKHILIALCLHVFCSSEEANARKQSLVFKPCQDSDNAESTSSPPDKIK